jgi:hypothetical protein
MLNFMGGLTTHSTGALDSISFIIESYIPRQLAAGSPIKKYGSPEGTAFPLVKGGVNIQPAKSACGALAMPPLFLRFGRMLLARARLIRALGRYIFHTILVRLRRIEGLNGRKAIKISNLGKNRTGELRNYVLRLRSQCSD